MALLHVSLTCRELKKKRDYTKTVTQELQMLKNISEDDTEYSQKFISGIITKGLSSIKRVLLFFRIILLTILQFCFFFC